MALPKHIIALIEKRLKGLSLDVKERADLQQWINVNADKNEIFGDEAWDKSLYDYLQIRTDQVHEDAALRQFITATHLQGSIDNTTTEIPNALRPARRIHFILKWWWAAAILIIGTTITMVMSRGRKYPASETTFRKITPPNDILPGGERAVLTLANGSTIALDSAANGLLAKQGNASVVKLANGEIRYDLKGVSHGEVMMNTMTTPRGGQYQLTLPDGSKVWLNAASSITYPATFVENNRKVRVTGEVYIEVAKDKSKPFTVDIAGKSTVEVLGTSFNANSYMDEGVIKTTLINGSVKINDEAILKPGQQAVQYISTGPNDSKRVIVKNANLSQTLAWKNGIFDFTDADLKTVINQLERWYDIKVQYRSSIPDIVFKGRMYRNANLSAVLQFLQKMGVKFELDGNNLIIL